MRDSFVHRRMKSFEVEPKRTREYTRCYCPNPPPEYANLIESRIASHRERVEKELKRLGSSYLK